MHSSRVSEEAGGRSPSTIWDIRTIPIVIIGLAIPPLVTWYVHVPAVVTLVVTALAFVGLMTPLVMRPLPAWQVTAAEKRKIVAKATGLVLGIIAIGIAVHLVIW